MATKKTEKPAEAAAAEVNNEAAEALKEAEEQNRPKDPWDETVSMLVPRKPKGEDQQYYICVNDRRYMVPANNKVQELPLPIAEILKDSLVMEEEAEEFAESIPNRGNEPPVPHPIG